SICLLVTLDLACIAQVDVNSGAHSARFFRDAIRKDTSPDDFSPPAWNEGMHLMRLSGSFAEIPRMPGNIMEPLCGATRSAVPVLLKLLYDQDPVVCINAASRLACNPRARDGLEVVSRFVGSLSSNLQLRRLAVRALKDMESYTFRQ